MSNSVIAFLIGLLIGACLILMGTKDNNPTTHYVLCPGLSQPIAATSVDPYGAYLHVYMKNGDVWVGPNCSLMPNPGDL